MAGDQQEAAQLQVKSADAALSRIITEYEFGERSTLDLLDAQQSLISARSVLIGARAERAVGAFAVLQAMGRLGPQTFPLLSKRPPIVLDPLVGKRYPVTLLTLRSADHAADVVGTDPPPLACHDACRLRDGCVDTASLSWTSVR